MTPTATYIAEENCLQELPRIEKPRKPNPYTDSIDAISLQRYKSEVAEYDRRMAEYTRHLATPRKIPCEPEPGFKDGEKYTEGVDYEIKGAGDWKWCYQLKGNIFAAPIVPVSEGQPGEIEKLRAENSKMRKALEEIAQKYADAEVLDDIGQFVFEMGELATEALK